MTSGILHYFFMGVWHEIWKFGLSAGIIICGGLLMWFTPFKKTGMFIMLFCGWGFISYTIGVIDEKRVWDAAEQRVDAVGKKARANAETYVDRHPVPRKRPSVHTLGRGDRNNRD